MKRVLLVAPASYDAEPIWNLHKLPFIPQKAFIAPLTLVTLAGLTEELAEVLVWDETLRGPIDPEAEEIQNIDLAGITTWSITLSRAAEIAAIFKKKGVLTAAGGPGITRETEKWRGSFDIIFRGDAERTWPRFLREFTEGDYSNEYIEDEFPQIHDSPLPRWDLLAEDLNQYLVVSIQTSRGCPFNCDFCTIPIYGGNETRKRKVESIIEELRLLEGLGASSVMFAADNFIGDIQFAKALLKQIVKLQKSFSRRLKLTAELSVNTAHDEELLTLLEDAGFTSVFIGIESPDPVSLAEVGKSQNLRGDLTSDCQTIMSYGMSIWASMIVGFDNDTTDTFERHFEFIQTTGIPLARIHLLQAIPNTPLWARMHAAGRLIDLEEIYSHDSWPQDTIREPTNILPALMTRAEMFEGYIGLLEKLSSWAAFAERTKKFISAVKRTPPSPNEDEKAKSRGSMGIIEQLGDKETQAIIMDVLTHTYREKPFLMEHVMGLVIRQHLDFSRFPAIRDRVQKQIQFETRLGIDRR